MRQPARFLPLIDNLQNSCSWQILCRVLPNSIYPARFFKKTDTLRDSCKQEASCKIPANKWCPARISQIRDNSRDSCQKQIICQVLATIRIHASVFSDKKCYATFLKKRQFEGFLLKAVILQASDKNHISCKILENNTYPPWFLQIGHILEDFSKLR